MSGMAGRVTLRDMGREEGRTDAALRAWEDVVRQHADAGDVARREQAARALNALGLEHARLGDGRSARSHHEEVLRRYGEAPELPLRIQVAEALFGPVSYTHLTLPTNREV